MILTKKEGKKLEWRSNRAQDNKKTNCQKGSSSNHISWSIDLDFLQKGMKSEMLAHKWRSALMEIHQFLIALKFSRTKLTSLLFFSSQRKVGAMLYGWENQATWQGSASFYKTSPVAIEKNKNCSNCNCFKWKEIQGHLTRITQLLPNQLRRCSWTKYIKILLYIQKVILSNSSCYLCTSDVFCMLKCKK